ncbi:MAG: hypothetical protein GEU88_07595 [Solirubrobacterales bacterium]|nr:hypothetical protein [Solirubrobacterales bacterium]
MAIFIALGGTATASHLVVRSSDIVDGQVKTPDLGAQAVTTNKLAPNSVGGGRVADGSLTGADIADESIVYADMHDNSIVSKHVSPGRTHGTLLSEDIADNSLTGNDIYEPSLDLQIPYRYAAVNDTGIICNTRFDCVEGSLLPLPIGGIWHVSAKIVLNQRADESRLFALCDIRVGSNSYDTAAVYNRTDGSFADDTLSLQALMAVNAGATPTLTCSDNAVGDVHGGHMKMTAIRVG